MTIHELYTHYQLPPNLIRHQLEVAAVAQLICKHWDGPAVATDMIVSVCLVHDMGNIVKFKRPFLGELEEDAERWSAVQDTFIATYGSDAYQATLAILTEANAREELLSLMQTMRKVWEDPDESVTWEARIAEYADCCVTPNGIEGFEARLADLINRYYHDDTAPGVIAMRENAKLVSSYTTIDLSTVPTLDLSSQMQALLAQDRMV